MDAVHEQSSHIRSRRAGLGAYMLLYEQFNIQVRELELAFRTCRPRSTATPYCTSPTFTSPSSACSKSARWRSSRAARCDGCVVTGDVTAEPRASDIFRRVCSVIKHRDPILMVLGNSEHKPWLDTDTLTQALTFDGLQMLINSSTTLTRGGDSISVVGVDDPYSRRRRPRRGLRRSRSQRASSCS